MSCRSQPRATSSSSVAAGEVRQSIAWTFRPAASISARMPGPLAVMAKYAKNPGWFQCVRPGTITRSKSATIASNDSPASGALAGSAARTSPGATRASTG
jgi:hypothetical protein